MNAVELTLMGSNGMCSSVQSSLQYDSGDWYNVYNDEDVILCNSNGQVGTPFCDKSVVEEACGPSPSEDGVLTLGKLNNDFQVGNNNESEFQIKN